MTGIDEDMGSAWTALALSLKVASCATLVCLVLGVGVGYVLARRRFPGRDLVDALLTLPMVHAAHGARLLPAGGHRAPGRARCLAPRCLRYQPDLHLAGRGDRREPSSPFRSSSSRRAPRSRPSTASSSRPRACSACGANGSLLSRDAAAGLARHPGGRAAGLRPRPRRVRRHADGGRQHPGQDADALDRGLRGGAGRAGRAAKLLVLITSVTCIVGAPGGRAPGARSDRRPNNNRRRWRWKIDIRKTFRSAGQRFDLHARFACTAPGSWSTARRGPARA